MPVCVVASALLAVVLCSNPEAVAAVPAMKRFVKMFGERDLAVIPLLRNSLY